MNNLQVALLQLQSGPDKKENLLKVERFIAKACEQRHLHLICLPEVFNFRGSPDTEKDNAELFSPQSETVSLISKLAKQHQVSIMAGTFLEQLTGVKPLNTTFYVNNIGTVLAKYSKIHLFDVNVANFRSESKTREFGQLEQLQSGSHLVFQDTFESFNEEQTNKSCQVNMATVICYDLRFPELFRKLMFGFDLMPDIIFLPSAFSKPTGEAHWEVLLRARAIENSVFIIAPNQVGGSESSFTCYGNSMVIDPWGRVLARASDDKEEILFVELDLSEITKVRKALPLTNARISNSSIFMPSNPSSGTQSRDAISENLGLEL